MSIATVVTRGYGSFGGVHFVPTDGYSPAAIAVTSGSCYTPLSTETLDAFRLGTEVLDAFRLSTETADSFHVSTETADTFRLATQTKDRFPGNNNECQ